GHGHLGQQLSGRNESAAANVALSRAVQPGHGRQFSARPREVMGDRISAFGPMDGGQSLGEVVAAATTPTRQKSEAIAAMMVSATTTASAAGPGGATTAGIAGSADSSSAGADAGAGAGTGAGFGLGSSSDVIGGVEQRPRDSLSVSGEIRPRGAAPDLGTASVDELIAFLDDKDLRRDAALVLCGRNEPDAVGPVFGVLRRMTRGEAARVIPAVVGFGERAVFHLIDGLRGRKSFLRQGCALALGVLKSAEGIEPLCDLLINEPTDMWREIARAIGAIGSGATMSLAARLRDSSDGFEERKERISRGLAHVASQGGRSSIETLAEGRDQVVAGCAKRALELCTKLEEEISAVRAQGGAREQTMNRAFSQRFFEAMAGQAPLSSVADELEDEDGLPLEDSEILDEDEELLDEKDLLPTD
ncbi:MAG: hypothetical protein V2A73_09555, partial [Pseudomonadota bacterium]